MSSEQAAKIEAQINAVAFNSSDLVCVVVQERRSREVLMVAWMNPEALRRTLTTGRAWYWSRSRQEYWRKGDSSGQHQYVHSVSVDCDADAILMIVDQVGAACHTGSRTCFEDRELSLLDAQHGGAQEGMDADEPTLFDEIGETS